MSREIEILYGHEFKVCRKKIEEKDFFYSLYQQALDQLKEIIEYGDAINSRSKSSNEYLHNIIAFCGDRGQGKTSAMLSFSDALSESDNNSEYPPSKVITGLRKLNKNFFVLDAIDPTQMEDDENILSIILSRLFMDFKNRWETSKQDKQSQKSIAKRNDIMERFQNCFKQIQTIKSKSKQADKRNSFEELLQDLILLGDSSNLKTDFKDLLKELFELHETGKRHVLVIQIDDTDLNTSKAFEIVEDLRKYLSMPDIVVFMASKIEQLCDIVEQEYYKDYNVLLKSRTDYDQSPMLPAKSYHIHSNPRHIAVKYMGKLIPENRRIYLPEPSAIPDKTEEKITLKYMRNIETFDDKESDNIQKLCDEQKISMEIINGEKMVNILKIYEANKKTDEPETKKTEGKQDEYQTNILLYMLQKTGIRFGTPDYGAHSILPKTMRGLVDLLALLSRLEDFGEPLSDKCKPECRIKENEKRLRNLNKFEQYFLKSWIPSNINEDYAFFLYDLANTPSTEKHWRAVTDIQYIMENTKPFSLTTNIGRESSAVLKHNPSKMNPMGYSVGDVMDALFKMETTLQNKDIELYGFAVRTLYTITMYKLYYRYEPTDRTNDKTEFTILDDFIGGDLFGIDNSKNFFPSYKKTGLSRGYFRVDGHNKELFASLTEKQEDKWNYPTTFVYQSYKSEKDFTYKRIQLIEAGELSKNRAFTSVNFWVSIRFVRRSNFRYAWEDNPHECYMLLLNMEYLWNVIKFQIAHPDLDKSKANISFFMKRFFINANKQLNAFEPIQPLLRQWFKSVAATDMTFLDNLFAHIADPESATVKFPVFPLKDFTGESKKRSTPNNNISEFKKAFDDFMEEHNLECDPNIYQDFIDFQKALSETKARVWDNNLKEKFNELIDILVSSLEPIGGD